MINKINGGRYLQLNIDSDNIDFCKEPDGYSDGYGAGFLSGNRITVYGETLDGSGYEDFFITGNGDVDGKKIFLSVTEIEGDLTIADPDYEPCVIELRERDPITTQNGSGEYAEVFDFANGSFIISLAKTSGSIPFEMISGKYRVSYPAFLNVKIPNVGRELYFGSDMFGDRSFYGVMDNLKIITEMSSDTRPHEKVTSGTRSVTRDFLSPNPSCPDDQTLLLTTLNDPIDLQSRRLRQKEFLNTSLNFKFKLDFDDRESLIESINSPEDFQSKMIKMGFDIDSAKSTFIECHEAGGGPIFNDARFIRSKDMLVSSKSVNDKFGLSGVFSTNSPVMIDNDMSYFRKDEGTIEFWVSPILDTVNDFSDRYYVDIFSAERKRVISSNPHTITLPSPAGEVLNIRLMTKNKRDSAFITKSEEDNIIFDEIYRSDITGTLTGGTGVQKDFSTGARITPDGRTIILKEALPSTLCDVIVSYIPANSNGERISIYKNKQSQIIFSIKQGEKEISTGIDVRWRRNTWHRIKCTYSANSKKDNIKLFVDGFAPNSVSYGDENAKYGLGLVYGNSPNSHGMSANSRKITLKDDFRVICIGGSSIQRAPALARIDNVRFSRTNGDNVTSPSGESIDLNYTPNTEAVLPVQKDDVTTLLLNFDNIDVMPKYAHVIDPNRGIFNFDIEVVDEFGRINDEKTEDLIVDLVNRLKPSHTSALVKFSKNSCK